MLVVTVLRDLAGEYMGNSSKKLFGSSAEFALELGGYQMRTLS